MPSFISDFIHTQFYDSLSVVFRLFLATVLGCAIGLDRGLKKRPAGLRTFALVSIGSTLAMITNEYLFNLYGLGDVSRMSAQVISGVGFLGAGTIIVTGQNRVKGLTTAAGLWATASMGIAIGAGFYLGAIAGFFAIMFAVTVLHNIDEKLIANSKTLEMYLEINKNDTLPEILDYIHKKGYNIIYFEKKGNALLDSDITVLLELNLKTRVNHTEVISEMGLINGVRYIEKIK